MPRSTPARDRREKALLNKPGPTRTVALLDAGNTMGEDVASASEVMLATATGGTVAITGTLDIESIPESPAGVERKFIVESDGGNFVHDPTSLILLGGRDITREAGDTGKFTSLGSGNWKMTNYVRAGGGSILPLYQTESTDTLTPGLGAKSATIGTNLGYAYGVRCRFQSRGANAMFEGVVSTYDATTGAIALAADNYRGTAQSDWDVNLGGLELVSTSGMIDSRTYWSDALSPNPSLDAAVASATIATDLLAAGAIVHVSGTTAITSLGFAYSFGATRILIFDDALTLTHHATDLILLTGANITTAAGDVAAFEYYTTAKWRCLFYVRKDGTPLVGATGTACTVKGRAANSSGAIADITIAESEILGRIGNVVDGFTLDDFTADDVAEGDSLIFSDLSASNETNSTTVSKLLGFAGSALCQGRLTLTSGTAVTTGSVTGATSVYFTPHIGDRITIYDGTRLKLYVFTELTLALGTLVNAQAYDVFIYDNAGTLTLETAEWANATITCTSATPAVVTWTAHGMSTGMSITFTNSGGALPTGLSANTQYFITKIDANTFKLSTTLPNVAAGTFVNTSSTGTGTHTGHQPQARQTALVKQNGAWYKTGALTRRYLGSFMTTATTTTEDSTSKRFLFNAHNDDLRFLSVTDATDSWTYTTATFRQANGSTANQFEVFVGLAEKTSQVDVFALASSSVGVNTSVGVGLNSTNTTSAVQGGGAAGTAGNQPSLAKYYGYLPVGYNVIVWLEISQASGTTTWRGDNGVSYVQTGMTGWIRA